VVDVSQEAAVQVNQKLEEVPFSVVDLVSDPSFQAACAYLEAVSSVEQQDPLVHS